MFTSNTQKSMTLIAALVSGFLATPASFAGELNVGSRVPTAQELIDHLNPASQRQRTKKTRGIRLTAPAPQAITVEADPAQQSPEITDSEPLPTVATSEPAPAASQQADPQPAEPTAISMEVLFAHNSYELTNQARELLHPLGQALQSAQLAGMRFMIEGHTDASGTEDYNLSLSQKRAFTVRDYLSGNYGVDMALLDPIGRGEYQLLDAEQPLSQVNRRVRIVSQVL